MRQNQLPILYSFRRCPYAMRARLGLAAFGVNYVVREVDLKNKPAELLEVSAKGTVPVLLLEGKVIDESLDILEWLGIKHKQASLDSKLSGFVASLANDFIPSLNRLKYRSRYVDLEPEAYYQKKLAAKLLELDGLVAGFNAKLTDCHEIAIFPFIRQLRLADPDWLAALGLVNLYSWLQKWDSAVLNCNIMAKHPVWRLDSADLIVYNNE